MTFQEASPDQFRISFTRGPKLSLESLEIRLAGSAAGAVFDDYTGLDLQSPSPSGAAITAVDYATPPDMTVTLSFKDFLEKRTLDFRSDLDDNGLALDIDQNHLATGELELRALGGFDLAIELPAGAPATGTLSSGVASAGGTVTVGASAGSSAAAA